MKYESCMLNQKYFVYAYLRLVPIQVLLSWFSTKETGVSSRLVHAQYLVELLLS
jgi:hypothetical protein